MKMLEKKAKNREQVEFICLENLVPQDHLLKKIDSAVDFDKLYEFVEELYRNDNGRPSIDPVILFKMVLIQHLYGITSLRKVAGEVSMNMVCRWFLGYTLSETPPHFSKLSYNFRHRFNSDTLDKIFNWLLEEIAEAGYPNAEAVFVDGTHIKADANTKKKIKEEVPIAAKRYAKESLEEINADREAHGKKPFALEYSTTNRDGYREYKSNPMTCKNCPTMDKCTKSKSCQKRVTRHIWNEYIELAENARHTPKYKELYKERKEKIERVFADAKEKYAMRYTPYRGLTAVRNWVRLKFATMNLKKFAIHKDMERKRKEVSFNFVFCFLNYFNLIFKNQKLEIQFS